jgi:TIR domain
MDSEHNITLNVFLAYARKDSEMRDRLEIHLSTLKRNNVIRTWYDGLIEGGKEWKKEILNELNIADIILLLVSADFIASDFSYDIEMVKALKRHEEGSAVVIPIILTPCDWQDTKLANLQVVPKDGTPISNWANKEDGYRDAAERIKQVVNNLIQEREKFIDQFNLTIIEKQNELSEIEKVISIKFKEFEQLKYDVKHFEKKVKKLPKYYLLNAIEKRSNQIKELKHKIFDLKLQLSQLYNFIEKDLDENITTYFDELFNENDYSIITRLKDHLIFQINKLIDAQIEKKSGYFKANRNNFLIREYNYQIETFSETEAKIYMDISARIEDHEINCFATILLVDNHDEYYEVDMIIIEATYSENLLFLVDYISKEKMRLIYELSSDENINDNM